MATLEVIMEAKHVLRLWAKLPPKSENAGKTGKLGNITEKRTKKPPEWVPEPIPMTEPLLLAGRVTFCTDRLTAKPTKK